MDCELGGAILLSVVTSVCAVGTICPLRSSRVHIGQKRIENMRIVLATVLGLESIEFLFSQRRASNTGIMMAPVLMNVHSTGGRQHEYTSMPAWEWAEKEDCKRELTQLGGNNVQKGE